MRILTFAALIITASSCLDAQSSDSDSILPGHSAHGPAFDTGPRQKPWRIAGIGLAHFPITTKSREVQEWFDQGHTLLHSYWYNEAERSFRWCLRLDPDCAMAYWGLARATGGERREAFLREALKRQNTVTERERLYINAWAERWLPPASTATGDAAEQVSEKYRNAIQNICIRYPDDIEAKTLYAHALIGGPNRYGTDALLQNVLAQSPDHPGALHYRIHIWDKREPVYILKNSAKYGSIAKDIPHGQHMVGHIYSGIGMWHEAAYSMDYANRMDLRYMQDHQVLPTQNWTYAHNRDFLSYVQEQLGMADAAIKGAKEIQSVALDSELNNLDRGQLYFEGCLALLRALMRFERWQEILDDKSLNWGSRFRSRMYGPYSQAIAYIGLKQLDKATQILKAYEALRPEVTQPENKGYLNLYEIESAELQALLSMAQGETKRGIEQLRPVISRDLETRGRGDPPFFGNVLATLAGNACLSLNDYEQAVSFFQRTLEVIPNDGFALAGLVRAYAGLGQRANAEQAMGRLLFVWSNADANLRWLREAKQTGITAAPLDISPAAQRQYSLTALQSFGSDRLERPPAPTLDAIDSEGKHVTLDRYRGRNVLIVFYIGEECPRCLQQLVDLGKRTDQFVARNTVVIALSPNSPVANATLLKSGKIPYTLLSDADSSNAKRFLAYDDFENMSLHSSVLVDPCGKVYWSRTGGEPFGEWDFLLSEIDRLNASDSPGCSPRPEPRSQRATSR
jgi:peroxiredoxin